MESQMALPIRLSLTGDCVALVTGARRWPAGVMVRLLELGVRRTGTSGRRRSDTPGALLYQARCRLWQSTENKELLSMPRM